MAARWVRESRRGEHGLTADCIEAEIDPERWLLLQTRPHLAEPMATIICPDHRPQMSTVRPKVMKAPEPDLSRVGRSSGRTLIYPEMSGSK